MMAKQGVNNASVSLQHGVCPGFGTRVDRRVRLGGKLESGILAVLPSCGSSGAVRAITVTFAIIPGRSQQRDLGTQHHTQPVPRRGMWKETQSPLKTPLTWQKRIVLLSAFLAGGQEGSLNFSKASTNTRTRARSSLSPGHLPCAANPCMSWAGEMCLSQSVGWAFSAHTGLFQTPDVNCK